MRARALVEAADLGHFWAMEEHASGGPGRFAVEGYDLLELIGAGVAGELWLARSRRDGEQVALRRLRLDGPRRAEQARRLVTLLTMIDHPHLQRVRESVPLGDELVLVLDHADGGNLDQLLSGRGSLDPGEVVTTVGPVAEALAAAHERGLVHGDINPESVLYMTDGRPLLADLGLLGVVAGPDTLLMHGYGDPAASGPPGASATPAGDVYSLAAVCYTALTGIIPQPGQPRRPLKEVLPDMPPGMIHAVEAAMHPRPDRRPTAEQFAERVYAACPPAPVRFPVGMVLSDADIAAALAQAGPAPTPPSAPPGTSPTTPPTEQGAQEAQPSTATGQGAPASPEEPVDPFARAMQGMHRPNQFGELPTRVEDDDLDDEGGPRVGLWLGIAAAVVALVAAGVGGWWWWQNNQGGGQPIAGTTTEPEGTTEPGRTADPTGGPERTAGPRTTTAPSRTARPTDEPTSTRRPTGPAARWERELVRLDKIRAQAFSKPDVGLLSEVYAPDATDLLAKDRKEVDICVRSGCRLQGLRYEIRDLDVVRSDADRTVLRVVDQRQAYTVVTAGGDEVPRPAGPVETRRITLTKHGGAWYIAAIEAD